MERPEFSGLFLSGPPRARRPQDSRRACPELIEGTPALRGFLLVDLARLTAHNPQLRLVLTLASRQFRTFGWQSLERNSEPNSDWFSWAPNPGWRG